MIVSKPAIEVLASIILEAKTNKGGRIVATNIVVIEIDGVKVIIRDAETRENLVASKTTSRQNALEVLANRQLSTGDLSIPEETMLSTRAELKLTELDLEVVIVTLCPCTLKANIIRRIILQIPLSIETGIHCPVLIDFSLGLETEHIAVAVLLHRGIVLDILVLNPGAMISVLQLAGPLNHVGMLLEIVNTNAEGVELILELGLELLDESLVLGINFGVCHSLGNNLSHLITSGVLVTAESAVAEAFDDTVINELLHSIISPMILRNIGEGVGTSKSRAGCTDDESRRQSGYESLFHEELLL